MGKQPLQKTGPYLSPSRSPCLEQLSFLILQLLSSWFQSILCAHKLLRANSGGEIRHYIICFIHLLVKNSEGFFFSFSFLLLFSILMFQD